MTLSVRETVRADRLDCLKSLGGSNVKMLAGFYGNNPSDIEVTLQLLPTDVRILLCSHGATAWDASRGLMITSRIHDVIAAAHAVMMELAERIPDADVDAYLET